MSKDNKAVPDFGHLERLQVDGRQVARYTFFAIEGEPWIEGRPAAECNKAYLNAVLKTSKALARRARAGGMGPAVLKENRDRDRDLYPRHVITGWGNVNNSAGEAVPFSSDNCEAFLWAVPDDMFDDARTFFSVLDNFREGVSPEEVERLKGN